MIQVKVRPKPRLKIQIKPFAGVITKLPTLEVLIQSYQEGFNYGYGKTIN